MKGRQPRIPLPSITAEERANLGERAASYEGRLRSLYMPGSDGRGSFGGFFGRDANSEMTLDYRFKTMLFWIVSRTNNCQYCLGHQERSGAPTRATRCQRPPLESRDQVEQALAVARDRTPRLPLADEDKTLAILAGEQTEGPLPQWMRLLANFPTAGKTMFLAWRSADENGDLEPLRKAKVSWIIARQDRAWYAIGQAKDRLTGLGWPEDQVYLLDGDWQSFSPGDRALFTVARKLAATPVVLTDADVAKALELIGPRQVVQLVSYVTQRVSFDRITEAAGLAVGH